MKYDLNWVINRYESNNNRLKYIFFWGHQIKNKDEVGKSCFSQWYESEFKVEEINYKTAEHWMMAEKARLFKDDESLEKILKSNTPGEAKQLGRSVKNFELPEWESKKYEIVKLGNQYKFEQNDFLKSYLLGTKDRILVEASPYDKIWGIGMNESEEGIENPRNWKGENLLGFAIMEVRDELGLKL
ncbi:MAG: NADAR family protein [Saprospiraceae bacterium]